MKQLIYKLIFLISIIALKSCEDPIIISLPDAEKVFVIDAWITTEAKIQSIILSQSQRFLENEPFTFIDNAEVIVTNHTRNESVEFQFFQNGQYTLDNRNRVFIADEGDNLSLFVQYANDVYESKTKVYPTTQIDTLYQEFREDEPFQPDGIYVDFLARDLKGIGNCYWLKSFKNDTFLNNYYEINISYDGSFDAGTIETDNIYFIPPIRELINPQAIPSEGQLDEAPFVSGDRSRLEIHSISTEAFSYLLVLRDQIANGDNAIFGQPFANPRSNIINAKTGELAAGFFNVATVSKKEIIIE